MVIPGEERKKQEISETIIIENFRKLMSDPGSSENTKQDIKCHFQTFFITDKEKNPERSQKKKKIIPIEGQRSEFQPPSQKPCSKQRVD